MTMNGKKSTTKSKPKQDNKPPKFRFINYDLTGDDKLALEALDLDAEFPLTLPCDFAMEGYKYSLAHDARNHCFIASLTDRVEASAFENSCLTGRGATPLDAFHSLCYRHLVLAQGDWSFFGDGEAEDAGRYF